MAGNALFGDTPNLLFGIPMTLLDYLGLAFGVPMPAPGWDFESGHSSGMSQLHQPNDWQMLQHGQQFIDPEILKRLNGAGLNPVKDGGANPYNYYDMNEITGHPWFQPQPFTST